MSARVFLARVLGSLRRMRGAASTNADLRAELESHVAMHAEENIRRGMTEADAWREARVASGGITQAAELARDQRSLPWLDQVMHELRESLRARVLVQHPGFSAAMILSLGVGISSAAGVFAVVDSARHAPLPFRDAERVEHLYLEPQSSPGIWLSDVPAVVARALGRKDAPVEEIASYHIRSVQLRDRDHVVEGWGAEVTDNFPTLLGQRALLGRVFAASDRDQPSAVLSRQFWQRQFGGDTSVIGRTVDLAGTQYTVLGIAAPETAFPEYAELWLSGFDATRMETQRNAGVGIVVRRRSDIGEDASRAQIVSIGTAAIAALGGRAAKTDLRVASLRDYLLKNRMRGVVLILSIIAVFVGFITAVNFAALTLARGIRRRGELGVRAALGASVPRLVRHVVGESVVLCAMGGVLAALLSPFVLDMVRDRFGTFLPDWLALSLSWRTIGLSVLLTVAIGIVFGLGPGLDLARPALVGFIRTSSSTATIGAGLSRTRSWLVAIQVSLATAVLVALGAAFGPALVIGELPSGFDQGPLIHASVRDLGIRDRGRVVAGIDRLVDDARQVPGVSAAAVTEFHHFFGLDRIIASSAAGSRTAEDAGLRFLTSQRVTADYFNVLRPKLIAGRFPTSDEARSGLPLAVITRGVADKMFDGHAIGGRLTLENTGIANVIGVVDDIRENAWETDAPSLVITPIASPVGAPTGGAVRTLLIRSAAPVTLTMRLLTGVAGQRIGEGKVSGYESVQVASRRGMAAFRKFAGLILAIFGVALGLAALGIYGLVAYTAEMRGRELAIREALGASRMHVAGRVLQGAVLQTLAGVSVGSVLAIALIDYLNKDQLRLTVAMGASAVALGVLALTVLLSSVGPLVAAWRRDISFALRAGG